jgi:hypothetical protein
MVMMMMVVVARFRKLHSHSPVAKRSVCMAQMHLGMAASGE